MTAERGEPQKEYIITEGMIKIWRNDCINLNHPHTDDEDCRKCNHRGRGVRKGCCDFDDNDLERIFRSRPYKSSDKVLEELEKEIDNLKYAWISADSMRRKITELRSQRGRELG